MSTLPCSCLPGVVATSQTAAYATALHKLQGCLLKSTQERPPDMLQRFNASGHEVGVIRITPYYQERPFKTPQSFPCARHTTLADLEQSQYPGRLRLLQLWTVCRSEQSKALVTSNG